MRYRPRFTAQPSVHQSSINVKPSFHPNAVACVGKQPIMVATASTEHSIGCKQQPIGCSVEAVATMIGCFPTQAIAFWWKPGFTCSRNEFHVARLQIRPLSAHWGFSILIIISVFVVPDVRLLTLGLRISGKVLLTPFLALKQLQWILSSAAPPCDNLLALKDGVPANIVNPFQCSGKWKL